VVRYKGTGDPNDAANFVCTGGDDQHGPDHDGDRDRGDD